MLKNSLFLADLKHSLQSENFLLRHALLSTQSFSFSTLSNLQRNTANRSKGHNATSNAMREFDLKMILLTRWSHLPELTLVTATDSVIQ